MPIDAPVQPPVHELSGAYDGKPTVTRTIGDWDIVFGDLGCGRRAYMHRTTGEVRSKVPTEVESALHVEEVQQRLPTPHCLTMLRPHALALEAEARGESPQPLWEPCGMQREDFFAGGIAFVLRGLLTDAEAAAVLQQAESMGFEPSPESDRIRVTDRVMASGGDFAELLFARARPHLEDISVGAAGTAYRGGKWVPVRQVGLPEGLPEGKWVPVGLNPCLRICRYEPGGFFLPHFDGAFSEGKHLRSFKTFMTYLNNVTDGGPTSFFNDRQAHYKKPRTSNVIATFQPECGACLVFNQQLLHDGGVLKAGTKYLLRTEVMYEYRGKI